MGQKIHPTGFRLAVTKNWTSRWFANSRNFPGMLNEDLRVRAYLKGKLSHASVGRVIIERPARDARITIHSARPGVVIGKKGEDIEVLKSDLRKLLGVQAVHVNIEEIRKPELDAQLVADSISQQLEKRIMFRRAMKRAMQNSMRLGAQGIKIMSAGRLNGIEIARTEWYREGRVPLHTLRADIDYGFSEAKTTYGVIGVKVWIYKGDVLAKNEQPPVSAMPTATPEPDAPRRARKTLARPGQGRTDAGVVAKPEGGAPPTDRPKGPPTRTRVRKSDAGTETKPDAAAKPVADANKPKPGPRRVKSTGDGDASTS